MDALNLLELENAAQMRALGHKPDEENREKLLRTELHEWLGLDACVETLPILSVVCAARAAVAHPVHGKEIGQLLMRI